MFITFIGEIVVASNADNGSDGIRCLVCPDGILPGMTGTCPKCGSRYRRGALVQEGRVKPKRRIGVTGKPPEPIDFAKLPWVSFQNGKDRQEAIDNFFAFYRQHPAKYQRRDPTELYEVVQATVDRDRHGKPVGMWRIIVKRKA